MDKFNKFMQSVYDSKIIELIIKHKNDLQIDMKFLETQTISVAREPSEWFKMLYKAKVTSPVLHKHNSVWIFTSSWTRFDISIKNATLIGTNVLKYIQHKSIECKFINGGHVMNMNISESDIKYLNECEKTAMKQLNYKNKIADEIKTIHNKIQNEYNVKTAKLIDELVKVNATIKVSKDTPEKIYPIVLHISTIDDFRWTTDKYILFTYCPMICEDMIMEIHVYCFGNKYFNKYGVNNMDMDVSFELDLTFAVQYLKKNNINYHLSDSPVKSLWFNRTT